MGDSAAERLAEHHARYQEAKPSHPVLLRAAADPALPAAFLVEGALRYVEAEYDGEELDGFCHDVLCARRDDAWMSEVYRMLRDPRPAAQELAADVLCQYGHDDGARPAAALHVRLLDEAIRAAGQDGDLWGLTNALGNQKHPDALPVLLRLRDHPDDRVRYAVQDSLLAYLAVVPERREELLDLLLDFARDEDAVVRGSFWYDVGSWAEIWEPRRAQLAPLLRRWREEPDAEVQLDMRRAYAVHFEGADFDDWEPPEEA